MQTDHSDDGASGRSRVISSADGASFVIDTASARVIAANAAGRSLWGITPRAEAIAVSLDRAMPALRVIAAAAGPDGTQGADAVWLTFWRPGGSVRGRFRLRRLSATTVEVIEDVPARQDAQRAVAGAAPAPASLRVAEPASTAPSQRRGDLDTLREIARRIREARCPTRDPGGKPPRPASETPLPVIAVADDDPPEPRSTDAAAPMREPAAPVALAGRPSGPAAPPPATGDPDARAVLARIVADSERLLDACERTDGALSHELRNHVGAIRSAARTALEHANIGPAVPHTFSQIDLEQLIEACRARASSALEAKGIRLVPSIGRRLPQVISDRSALTKLCDGLIEAPLLLEPSDGTLSLAVRHAVDGPVVLAASFRPPAGTFARFEPRLAALRSLARSIGCTLDGDTSPTGLVNLRLEIPKSRLIPV